MSATTAKGAKENLEQYTSVSPPVYIILALKLSLD